MLYNSRHTLCQLLLDRQGSALPLIGFSLLVLLLASGIGIDISRGEALQSKIQSTLDGAGLAAGGEYLRTANITTAAQVAQEYFNNNLPKDYLGDSSSQAVTFSSACSSAPIVNTGCITLLPTNQLQLTANIRQPTTLMSLLHVSSMTVGATSVINVGCNNTCAGHPLVYIADSNNNRIAVYDTTGKYCTQFGVGTLHNPQQLAFDSSNTNLYVLDVDKGTGYTRLSKFSLSDGKLLYPPTDLSILTGGGCSFPLNTMNGGIAVDPYGSPNTNSTWIPQTSGYIYIPTAGGDFNSNFDYGTYFDPENTGCGTGIMVLSDTGSGFSYIALFGKSDSGHCSGSGNCFAQDGARQLYGVSKIAFNSGEYPGGTLDIVEQGSSTNGMKGDDGTLPGVAPFVSYEGGCSNYAGWCEPNSSGSAYSTDQPFAPASIAVNPTTHNLWMVSNAGGTTWISEITDGQGFNKYNLGHSDFTGDFYLTQSAGFSGYYPSYASYGAAFDNPSSGQNNLYLTDYYKSQVVVLNYVEQYLDHHKSLENNITVSTTFGSKTSIIPAGPAGCPATLNGPIGIAVQQTIPVSGSCDECNKTKVSPTGTLCQAGRCLPGSGYNPLGNPNTLGGPLYPYTPQPSTTKCDTTNPLPQSTSPISPPCYPYPPTQIDWDCDGINNGANAHCVGNPPPVFAACGPNLSYTGTTNQIPPTPSCSLGTTSPGDDTYDDCHNLESWYCHGYYGGDVTCVATNKPSCVVIPPPPPPPPCGSDPANSTTPLAHPSHVPIGC